VPPALAPTAAAAAATADGATNLKAQPVGLGLRAVVDDSLSEASGDDGNGASPTTTAGYDEAHKFMTSCVFPLIVSRFDVMHDTNPTRFFYDPSYASHHQSQSPTTCVISDLALFCLIPFFVFCFFILVWVFLFLFSLPLPFFFSPLGLFIIHAGTSRIHHHQTTTAQRS